MGIVKAANGKQKEIKTYQKVAINATTFARFMS